MYRDILRRKSDITKAIEDISFHIDESETLALLGKTGSGKSTIGITMLRLIEPDRGDVLYNDINIMKLKSSQMRKIRKDLQIIFQDPTTSLNPIYPTETVLKEVLMNYKILPEKEINEQIDILLQQVGISPSLKNRLPHEFSTGQRQRICIARALAMNPRFLVLDEVTSALDTLNQKNIIDLLLSLQQNYKLSYLFITHNIELAKIVSHHIAFIKSGKIILSGKTEEVSKDIYKYFTGDKN